MDGYRDFYPRPLPAGYYSSRYPAGYGVERRIRYTTIPAVDPLYPTYRPRAAALRAFGDYGYQPEFIPVARYPAPVRFLSPRRRINPKRRPPSQRSGKGRPLPAENLAPKRKLFKKTQRIEYSSPALKRGLRKRGSQGNFPRKQQENAGKKEKASAATLAKETQELHKLFRSGVDTSSEKRIVKATFKQADVAPGRKKNANAAALKKKTKEEKKVEPPSSQKKRKRGKKKMSAKEKQETKNVEKPIEPPKAVKPDPAPPTEEEKRELEVALELQVAACKDVAEFLGASEKSTEPELQKSEPAEDANNEPKEEVPGGETEHKLEAPKLSFSPEEEKELEEKGYQFFSKLLEENGDLRKLYLDKKDAGTFECLVCYSADPETSKKFANLMSLVMHTSMRKQKRPEHRGYGKAICDILGWESLRAPKQSAKQVKDDLESTKQMEDQKQEGTDK